MYQIALCDDDPRELTKIQALLEAYQLTHPEQKFVAKQFTSINRLLAAIKEDNSFELLLLDVYLPEKTGIEGAKELRENGFDGSIIFLTTSKDHALAAFGVNAAQYLLKPVCQEDFFTALNHAFREIEKKQSRYFLLRVDGKLRRLETNPLIYTETQSKYQNLYFANNEQLRVRLTFTELWQILSEFSDFARAGSAYIINLSHVDSLTAKTAAFDTGKVIWLPRGSYPTLKEQYFKYYRSGRGD